jgi:hypothetical protein
MANSQPRVSAAKRGAFNATFRPFINRAALRGRDAIEQMAEDFRIFAANAGSVSETDLQVLGWRQAQITSIAADAREYADRSAAG